MGDRTSCYLIVGGNVTHAGMRAIMKAIDNDLGETGDELPDEGEVADFGEFNEVNYGSMPDELFDALMAAGASFEWKWCAGGDYGEGYQRYIPGPSVDVPKTVGNIPSFFTLEREEVVSVVRLLAVDAAGRTIRDVIDELDIPDDVPALHYIDEDDADPGAEPKPGPLEWYTVVGVHESGDRYCDHIQATSTEQAEEKACNENPGLRVASVFAGQLTAIDKG